MSLKRHVWKKPANFGVPFSVTHSPPPCHQTSDVCFQSSSGETVTSLVSMSPALPKKERRYRKKRSKDYQVEIPPEIPVKGKQVPQFLQSKPMNHTSAKLVTTDFSAKRMGLEVSPRAFLCSLISPCVCALSGYARKTCTSG